jgi:DNA-binding FadR family transcriptional regulator
MSLMRAALTETDALRENVTTVLKEHVAIFEAIRDGDSEKARRSMTRHMSNFAAKVAKHSGESAERLPPGSAEVLL